MTESPDTTTATDEDTGSTAAPGETAQATADSPDTASPTDTGTAAQPPEQGTPDAAAARASLTPPPQQTQQPAQTPREPEVDWQKRYRDQQSYHDRQANTWRERLTKVDSEMSELRRYRQEQEARAKAASLKPWSKASPDHGKFNGLLERARTIDAQLRNVPANLPPEQAEATRQAILSGITPDEQAQIQEYRQWREDWQRGLASDPESTLMPMVDRLVEARFQAMVVEQTASADIDRDFKDPALAPLIERHAKEFHDRLARGMSYQDAKEWLVMTDRLGRLEHGQQAAATAKVAADAQRAAAKGEASITRDARAPEKDLMEEARRLAAKEGIPVMLALKKLTPKPTL